MEKDIREEGNGTKPIGKAGGNEGVFKGRCGNPAPGKKEKDGCHICQQGTGHKK